jgi:acetylglutamate kinase
MAVQRKILLNLLHNLGTRREVSQYLNALAGGPGTRRVLIKVGGGVLEEQPEELAASLACLAMLGVRPVLIHGGGPQLTRALAEAGIDSRFIEGKRVTTPEVLAIARRVFQGEGHRLADALERQGVRARPISSGVFHASRTAREELGLVGEVSGVELTMIHAALSNGQIPVVSPLGESAQGQILNINADTAARDLAVALPAHKIVFLTPTGGLLDKDGAVIPSVDLASDFDRLALEGWVTGGMELKLREIREILDRLPQDATVSITSPEHLAAELFTHKGAGTLVRKGVTLRAHEGGEGVDRARLARLIEASFGRPLVGDYFETYAMDRVYIAGDYLAGAVFTRGGPAPYLDKFAVTREAQGLGIAATLWGRLCAEIPRFCWRSRSNNEINAWYFARADGMHRAGEWVVFWRGLRDADAIRRSVEHALALPASLASMPRQEVPVAV